MMNVAKGTVIKGVILFLLLIVSVHSYSQIDSIFNSCPLIRGDYFSEAKPGLVPEVFAPYLLNSEVHHLHSAPVFTPGGKEMFFSVYVNNEFPQRIFYAEKQGDIWQKPRLAVFSGTYQEGGPVISPNGNTLYYYSKRPDIDGDEELAKSRIWYVKKKEGEWTEPKVLNFPDYLGIAFNPSFFSTDSIFYFDVVVKERDPDIYLCRIVNNKPIDIKRLDEPISLQEKIEGGAITDPENKVLIFYTFDRLGKKKLGLYISDKKDDGFWNEPKLIDKPEILSHSRFANFTPDGKFFFFSSYKDGYEQIFWISSKRIFDNIRID